MLFLRAWRWAHVARISCARLDPSALKTCMPRRWRVHFSVHPNPLSEIDTPLSVIANRAGQARRLCWMYSAALIAESHSELLMEPSPQVTREMASDGHWACDMCAMASARPTACGPCDASVDVTR